MTKEMFCKRPSTERVLAFEHYLKKKERRKQCSEFKKEKEKEWKENIVYLCMTAVKASDAIGKRRA